MLVLRIGQSPSPDNLKCSGCPNITHEGEILYYSETDPAASPKNEIVLQEVTTWCKLCYDAIKSAAACFDIPIEEGFVPEDVRYVPDEMITVAIERRRPS